MDLPQVVKTAVARKSSDPKYDVVTDFCLAPSEARLDVDRYLLSTNHRLCYQPGTRQHRFEQLVKENYEQQKRDSADASSPVR
jgi:hypothetical protein